MSECDGYCGYTIKSNTPYITSHKLRRMPPSEEAIWRAKYIDEHDFSVSVNKETGEITCTVTEKKHNEE